jgi:hypothetical protein
MFGLTCKSLLLIAIPSLAMMAMGCGEQSARYQVAGKVLIDGEPLPAGLIRFVPDKGRPATGGIGWDGSFTLSQTSVSSKPPQMGIPPGNYRVAVVASQVIDEDAGEVDSLVPSKYADFRTSEIAFQIDRPRDDLVVALSSDIDEVTSGEGDERASESSPDISEQEDLRER